MKKPRINLGAKNDEYSGKASFCTNPQATLNHGHTTSSATHLQSHFLFWISKIIITTAFLTSLCGCKARQPARPTPQMDAEPQFWVRVRLLDDVNDCKLKIRSPFTVSTSDNPTAITQDAVRTNAVLNIHISNGRITIGSQDLTGSEITISPDEPYIFYLNGDDYRGKLKLIPNSDANSFDAVNLVPLEPYLAGVVGAEMPKYWEPTALNAQAIASRSYCLYIKKHFGGNRNWDVRRTQAHQVYLGVKAESAQVWRAVNETNGQVLVCKNSAGTEEILPAYYSSVCGGYTENSEHVFGDFFEALAGVRCPYCKDVARPHYFFWPAVQFDKTYVTKRLLQRYPKLKRLGKITNIEAAKQSDYEGNYGKYSRLTLVKLLGSTGKSDFLRAEDFRLSIDPSGRKIKSAIFKIADWDDKWVFLSGRGFGHGVGMCQSGAQGMARQGKTTNQILNYYYPGSRIIKVY
jgi:stage II sporulation protein D